MDDPEEQNYYRRKRLRRHADIETGKAILRHWLRALRHWISKWSKK